MGFVHPPDRRSAVAAGESTYFTGRPCPHGHVALRYTSNAACLECLVVKSYDNRVERIRADPAPRTCRRCGSSYRARSCPPCRTAWRRANPPTPERRAELAAAQRARTAKCRRYVRGQRERSCTDCGACFPWFVMDFDHPNGMVEGAQRISALVGRGNLGRIITELASVDLVCANCHRVRTHTRAVAAGERTP